MRGRLTRDQFGLGWRPELAAGILANLHRIDLLEVLADDYLGVPGAEVRSLETLAAQIPIALHGTGLGLASAAAVDGERLAALARLVIRLRPLFWSEHLAFVRAGGVDIGHLAAPPRDEASVAGAAANLARAARVVGSPPLMENVATLIDPPGSSMSEAEWVAAILGRSGCDLLIDLHNLHANARNFGFDPIAWLDRIPPERFAAVHLAGGRAVRGHGAVRLLDDHLHDVPEPVFELLAEVGVRASRPLCVILERDGNYPPIESLLAELDRARGYLDRGRMRRSVPLEARF